MIVMQRFVNKHKLFVKYMLGFQPKVRINYSYKKERHGNDYGGWTICPTGISRESIVYSFGIGKDISFDLSMIQKYGLTVYGFDPTPKSIEWVKKQSLPEKFVFFEIGVSNYDGIAKFKFPKNKENVSFKIVKGKITDIANITVDCKVKRIVTIMKELNHQKIDILKMDIEGAEYDVINDMLYCNIFPKQLLVEFHFHRNRARVKQTEKIIEQLENRGYNIFNVSPTGREFSFILDEKDV